MTRPSRNIREECWRRTVAPRSRSRLFRLLISPTWCSKQPRIPKSRLIKTRSKANTAQPWVNSSEPVKNKSWTLKFNRSNNSCSSNSNNEFRNLCRRRLSKRSRKRNYLKHLVVKKKRSRRHSKLKGSKLPRKRIFKSTRSTPTRAWRRQPMMCEPESRHRSLLKTKVRYNRSSKISEYQKRWFARWQTSKFWSRLLQRMNWAGRAGRTRPSSLTCRSMLKNIGEAWKRRGRALTWRTGWRRTSRSAHIIKTNSNRVAQWGSPPRNRIKVEKVL